ncbi:UNVERIFIED_CONTAM: hypothetical protein Scaly_0999200 [Sesamum calycinum]|uniref:Reverse transcriptase Ty1/copia-type domain-containing protein n=1 Tax=Sesamum calycinum TaxID=2727403 RepID=A0AAW2QZD5_9LAMI
MGVNPSSTSPTYEESDEPRRTKRTRVVKDFESDIVTYNIEDDLVTFKDVMASSEAKQWKEISKKLKLDRTIDKFKVRVVGKGFKQNEGIDYFDTYSLIVRLPTIRVLIALASVYNLLIPQMNVKIAFLYAKLEEKIYTDHPEGFVAHVNERKVCKLVKVLRYLKDTVSLAIHYGRFPTVVERYSDASWIPKNSRSNGCSGYVFILGGDTVS